MSRRWKTLCAVGSLALAVAAGAPAGNGNREQIHLNRADQAAARAVVIRKSDLGSSTAWKGGPTKPDTSPGPSCPGFNPKHSDLVATGLAESEFSQGLLSFDSHVEVLQTAHMVQLDWQRQVLAPGLLPCLRTYLAKSAPAGSKVISVKRLAFPRVAQYTAAFRLLMDVTASGTTVRLFIDFTLVARNRTELTVTTAAPYAARASVTSAEIRLARLLVKRMRA